MFQQREASIVFERVNRTGARIVCTRRKKKSAVSFDIYSQQFTLCYCLFESLLLCIRY